MAKPKKPKPFDVDLTPDQLRLLGDELAREIDDALSARASIIGDGGMIDLSDWFYEQGQSQQGDRPFPGAADLTSFLATQDVDALRARLMKAIWGVRPFCFVEGWGADAKKAPFVEEFHDWQVRKSDLKQELAKTIHGALIEDCYILEVSERVETRKITEQINVALELHPTTGGPVFEAGPDGTPRPRLQFDEQGDPVIAQEGQPSAKAERTYTKTKRLGPQYDAISMKDFVFLPGHAKSQKEVWGYTYRFYKRLPELQEMVEDGIYDEKAVKALGESSDRESAPTPPPVDGVAAQYGPSVEKELFQLSLKRDLDEDGREEWYIATISLKTRTLLRLKLDTFAQKVGRSRCVPFVLFPRRNSVYGYSLVFNKLITIVEEHTGLRNMTADRSALATNTPMTQLTGGLWDSEAQPFGVGRVIQVRQHDEVKQLQVADVPASVFQQLNLIMIANERVSGLADSAVGVLSAEHRTLGEQKLVGGGSAVRVDEVMGHLHTSIADVMALSHAIWVETLQADPKGLEAPDGVAASLSFRTDTEFDGKFTAEQLMGDFQFEPYGSDDLADPQKRRSDFDSGFMALAKLAEIIPGLRGLLTSPQVAKATLEQWLRSYNVRDRQPFLGAFSTAPPIPAPGAGPGGPPMGAAPPGGPPLPAGPAGAPDITRILAALTGGQAGGPMPGGPGGPQYG